MLRALRICFERALELVAGQHRPWEALVNADLAVLYAEWVGLMTRAQRWTGAAEVCAKRRTGAVWQGACGSARPRWRRSSDAPRSPASVSAQAIGVFRRYQLPWDEAQALECWGASLIKSGDGKAGDRRLDAAATLYRRHGAGPRWLQRVARIRVAARNEGAPSTPAALAETLSKREVEVLCLVAAGRSNQDIADALHLSIRTVERHLGHVYNKLGASGRSARAVAAAYGVANGLVPATAR